MGKKNSEENAGALVPVRGPGGKLITQKEAASVTLPSLVYDAGENARWKFIEFFAASIRNRHTRRAYLNAVNQFFAWCETRGVNSLSQINPTARRGLRGIPDATSDEADREASA